MSDRVRLLIKEIIMLEIKDLHAKIGDKEILKGINLTIKDGETHAIRAGWQSAL